MLVAFAFVIPGLMPDSSELRALVYALESKSPSYSLRVVSIGWRSTGQPVAYLGGVIEDAQLDELRLAFFMAWDRVAFRRRPAKRDILLVTTSLADGANDD